VPLAQRHRRHPFNCGQSWLGGQGQFNKEINAAVASPVMKARLAAAFLTQ
jgi:hypothetical protein